MTIEEKVFEVEEPKKEKRKRTEKEIIQDYKAKCIIKTIYKLNKQRNFVYNKDENTIIIFNTDYYLNNPQIITRILETLSSNTNTNISIGLPYIVLEEIYTLIKQNGTLYQIAKEANWTINKLLESANKNVVYIKKKDFTKYIKGTDKKNTISEYCSYEYFTFRFLYRKTACNIILLSEGFYFLF